MAQPDFHDEFRKQAPEPLLPIEKKLIVWSISIGVALLIGLAILNRLVG
jgi:hypothetical protein